MLRRGENKENTTASRRPADKKFAHGTIVIIKFRNFLTYDDVTFRPGHALNVIIGPNGTGKSSIMCGICLALGASPKVLGRSDSFGDFVKHGKDVAFVDLSLWDNIRKRKTVFRILINKSNKAVYFIDGVEKKRAEVDQAVKSYNIQIDNPCSFLAQDKVKSFAEQGPEILLINTEMAGPKEFGLFEKHQELKEKYRDGETYSSQLGRNQRRLEVVEVDINTKKPRVDNFLQRERQHLVLDLLNKKRVYKMCNDKRVLLEEVNNRVKETKLEMNKLKNKNQPMQNAVEQLEGHCKVLKRDFEKSSRDQADIKARISTISNSLSVREKMQDSASELARTHEMLRNWDKEKHDIIRQYRQFKEIYERTKADNVPNPEIEQNRQNLFELEMQLKKDEEAFLLNQSEMKRQQMEFDRKRNRQREIFDSKLKLLAKITRDNSVINAWNFYEENLNKFRCKVYVPFLHLQVYKKEDLIFLNNTISARDLAMFIFGCVEDQDLIFKNAGSTKINATIEQYREPNVLSNELKQLGFTSFIAQLFHAPPPVKFYLASTLDLNRVLIGDQRVDNDLDQIAKRVRCPLFLTKSSIVRFSASKYSDNDYVFRNNLKHNFYLSGEHLFQENSDCDAGSEQISCHLPKLSESRAKIESDRMKLKNLKNELQGHLTIEANKRSRVMEIERRLKQNEDRLKEYSKQKPDLEMVKAAYHERKAQTVNEVLKNYQDFVRLMVKQKALLLEWILSKYEFMRMKKKVNLLLRQKDDMEERFKTVNDKLVSEIKRRNLVEDEFQEDCEEFTKLSGISATELAQFEGPKLDQLRKEFEEHNIPDDGEQLMVRIMEEQDGLNVGRQEGTKRDVEEFEKLKQEKAQLQVEIQMLTHKNNSWKQTMDQILEEWLTPLRQIVHQISEKFSDFFERLNCAGEVLLSEPENKYAIDGYGITIMVKFRHGNQLRPLSAQTQSGGERSVSTMCYLMALQDLSPVPFRCVDEINQGMDPDNERAIFNMMVALLTSGTNLSKTQYFLLTPKLLNGLKFNNAVTVHVVHNGPAIENGDSWDTEKVLQQ